MNKQILFSTPMVKAIIDGNKRMTRRAMKPQPVLDGEGMWQWKDCQWKDGGLGFPKSGIEDYSPYKVGDVMWVRETWAEMPYGFVYRADEEEPEGWDPDDRWNPSIHMPKGAARLFLRVTDVRVERLTSITGNLDELEREGINSIVGAFQASMNFAELWDGLLKSTDIGTFGWDANPWVWVYAFAKCEKPEGFVVATKETARIGC